MLILAYLCLDHDALVDSLLIMIKNMAMDSEGNLLMKIGSNMAMDMDSGEIHLTSEWPSEENSD